MLCCLLAGLLAFAGIRGRREPPGERPDGAMDCDEAGGYLALLKSKLPGVARRPGRVAGFGACCGVLAFQVVAVLATWWGGLNTRRPELLLVSLMVVTVLGALFAVGGGAPTCRRAWALFALSASGASAVSELLDLHLLRIHSGEDLAATIALHGLAVVAGLIGGQLLLSVNSGAREFTPARLRGGRAARPAPVTPPR